jgi:predicted amidohydrolase
MKVASAQIHIVSGDPSGNLSRAIDAVHEAKQLGADFVVLPECSNFGWTDPSAVAGAVSVEHDSFVINLQEIARDLAIYVAVGFVERAGNELFNAAVLIDTQGEIVIHHQKINELDFVLFHHCHHVGDGLCHQESPSRTRWPGLHASKIRGKYFGACFFGREPSNNRPRM